MGILLSAMGGAADAGSKVVNEDFGQQQKLEAMNRQSDLETNKAKLLADYQVSLQNQQRQALVDRTNTGRDNIVQGIIARNAQGDNGGSDYTSDTDKTPATFDRMDTADQTNPAYQPTTKEIRDATIQSAVNNGDISPADLMKDTSKADIAQLRGEGYAAKNDTMMAIAQLRLDAAKEKEQNGKISASTVTMLLNSENKNIDATKSLIGTLTRQLPDLAGVKHKEERDGIQRQIEEYKQDIKNSKDTKNMYLKSLGYKTVDDLPEEEAPAPTPIPIEPFNPANFQKK